MGTRGEYVEPLGVNEGGGVVVGVEIEQILFRLVNGFIKPAR